MREVPDDSINMCITSPPYFNLRDYGISGQLGLEKTVEDYITNLCGVFDEVKRVLRRDGTCWVNLGDSYGKDKGLLNVPMKFAIEMCNHGWILRNNIIWHKPNPMPSSVKDRFTIDYENLFFFVKSKKYWFEQQLEPYTSNKYDQARMKKPRFEYEGKWSGSDMGQSAFVAGSRKQVMPPVGGKKHAGKHDTYSGNQPEWQEGRNMRTTWAIATAKCKEAHFAVFPEKLIETPIRAGCPEGGVVLDPFSGTGTTGVVAKKLGRDYLLLELNPEYAEITRQRIEAL